MSAKHTPGPWVQVDNPREYGYSKDYKDTVWGPRGPGYGLVADCRQGTGQDTSNAKLIAAATDLLEALKRIREIGGFSGLDHLDSVAALIAQAEGRAE